MMPEIGAGVEPPPEPELTGTSEEPPPPPPPHETIRKNKLLIRKKYDLEWPIITLALE